MYYRNSLIIFSLIPRYEPTAHAVAAPKRNTSIAEVASSKSVFDGSDTDSDDDDSRSALWERGSEAGSISSEAVDEDLKKREEELREELMIATLRCTQLKATLRETKSFFQGPSSAAVIVPSKATGTAAVDSDEDVDVDEYGDSDLEESWTEQSADVRDAPGKKLFDAKDGRREVDLDSTAPRLQVQAPLAVKVNPYYNLQDAPSPSGRLSDRIERLRQRCIQALGRGAFEDAYSYLKEQENVCDIYLCVYVCRVFNYNNYLQDDRGFYEEEVENEKQRRVRAILGEGKAHFMPLIEQLIFMEETHSS